MHFQEKNKYMIMKNPLIVSKKNLQKKKWYYPVEMTLFAKIQKGKEENKLFV